MINKIKNCTVAVLLFLFLIPLASAQLTPNIWKKFIGEPVPAGTPDLIDHSYAGYKNGTEGIPEDFDYPIYNVTDYGAVPDDNKSDTAAIRATLDAASAGSCIVFFPPGQYDVLLDDDIKEPFVIAGHHTIVRGSGAQGADNGGTTIKAYSTIESNSPFLFGTINAEFDWGSKTNVKGAYPSGTKSFEVYNATNLINRKYIAIRGFGLRGEDFEKYSSQPTSDFPESYTRIREGITLREYHEIDRIEGNLVYLKAPVVTHLSNGMVVHWIDLQEGIGFEDLHIDGSFDEVYEHLVQGGRGGISLWETAHSWIRRCRISNVIDSYFIGHSYGTTAVSNIVDGRFGHNLGNIFGSTYCLTAFLEDWTDRGMVHGAAVSHYAAGSVVWHVGGQFINGPDTHGAQPRHTLFDNYYSLNHQASGGGVGSLPHHLDGYTRWNNTVADSSTFNLWNPGGYNFAATQANMIGYKTLGCLIPRNAYVEGFGTHVHPSSLYEAQLEHRLGTLPAWIDAAKEEHKKFFESISVDPGQPVTSPDDSAANLDPTRGSSKIEGPWLWVLLPDEHLNRTTDLLAKVSGGTVTEQQISIHGASPGDIVGDYAWTPLKISPSAANNINGMVSAIGWDGNSRVIYGSISIDSPKEQHTRMFVGHDDALKVWLNGKLVHEKIVYYNAYDYQRAFPVTLKQGQNTLLVAVSNGTGRWSGYFGFQADAEYTILPFAGVGYALSNYVLSNGVFAAAEIFTVDLYAENVTDLAGWQFDVAFDRLLLEVLEVNNGYFLESAGAVTLFQQGTIDNQIGKITDISNVTHNGNSVSGTGLLLSLTFAAKAGGKTQLRLNNFRLADSIGREIPAGPLYLSLMLKGTLLWDVNEDGSVSILDLVLISQDFGKTGTSDLRTDVNSDGKINILDLILVAQHFGESEIMSAPTTIATKDIKGLEPATVQMWIAQARVEDDGSFAFQKGIANLERLLIVLTPEKTMLLPNYPNPFNPETWIPYQLSEPAEVTLTIYTLDGKIVRALALGHKPVGIYQSRSRAIHWDGRNDIGEPVASGVYFYTLTAGEFSATRKMLIRK